MLLREPWRTRLLFVSFAVNLVAVPLAASHYVVRQPPLVPPGAPPPELMIERMAERMPAEDAGKLRAAMEPHVESIAVARVHMEAARRELMRTLSSPSFERDAAQAAMQRWQTTWLAWSRAFGEAMLDGLGQISPDARSKLNQFRMRPRP